MPAITSVNLWLIAACGSALRERQGRTLPFVCKQEAEEASRSPPASQPRPRPSIKRSTPYLSTTPSQLLMDFWRDVEKILEEEGLS